LSAQSRAATCSAGGRNPAPRRAPYVAVERGDPGAPVELLGRGRCRNPRHVETLVPPPDQQVVRDRDVHASEAYIVHKGRLQPPCQRSPRCMPSDQAHMVYRFQQSPLEG
jgi:hypothetical protein